MLDTLQNTWQTVYGFISRTVTSSFPYLHIILIVIAGCFGSMLYGKIKPAYHNTVLRAVGIGAVLMGFYELWDGFFVLQVGQFETTGTFLVALALLLGYAFGDALAIHRSLGKLGVRLYRIFVKDPAAKAPASAVSETKNASVLPQKSGAAPSADGFMLAAVICAFSGSTIRWAVESQSAVDAVPLLIKLFFDIAVIFVLSALYGSNVPFAAVPTFVVSGALLLVNQVWGHLLTPTLMSHLVLIGAVILISTGISLGLGKKVRSANLIPAFFVPIIYGLIMLLVNKLMEAE